VFPAPNKEAATIARIIVEQVICRFGTPLSLVTDRARELDGDLMREICRLLAIDKLRTTPYKASTNAAVERFHRTLNGMIGRMIDERQRDWDTYLPYIMAAYRSSRHESTHYTPNFLMLGREVRAPEDILYSAPDALLQSTVYIPSICRRATAANAACSPVCQRAFEGIAADRTKRYYDLRIRPQKYGVGDWVYYYNPRKQVGCQDKWRRTFSSPFLVVVIPGPVNVMLQRSQRAKSFCTHIDKVKPYVDEQMPRSWLSEQSNDNRIPAADIVPMRQPEVHTTDTAIYVPESVTDAIAGVPSMQDYRKVGHGSIFADQIQSNPKIAGIKANS